MQDRDDFDIEFLDLGPHEDRQPEALHARPDFGHADMAGGVEQRGQLSLILREGACDERQNDGKQGCGHKAEHESFQSLAVGERAIPHSPKGQIVAVMSRSASLAYPGCRRDLGIHIGFVS